MLRIFKENYEGKNVLQAYKTMTMSNYERGRVPKTMRKDYERGVVWKGGYHYEKGQLWERTMSNYEKGPSIKTMTMSNYEGGVVWVSIGRVPKTMTMSQLWERSCMSFHRAGPKNYDYEQLWERSCMSFYRAGPKNYDYEQWLWATMGEELYERGPLWVSIYASLTESYIYYDI